MSLEQARLYIARIECDVAFRKHVMGIEDFTERLQYIKSEGINCNEADIRAVSGELFSDEELDSIAVDMILQFEDSTDPPMNIGIWNRDEESESTK